MVSIVNWGALRKAIFLSTTGIELCSGRYWDKRAALYNEHIPQTSQLTKLQLSAINLLPDYTVLDIGAGKGRITVPVAKRVKQVTAVDPSEKMLAILKAYAEKESVSNISCVNLPWEALDVGCSILPHDVVIASMSLFMVDLEKELKKMDAAARKSVYLFMSASKWMDDEMQNAIYGAPIYAGSDHLYIFNMLYDLGILANVKVWDYDAKQSYANLNDAVSNFMEHYNLLPKKEGALRGHLQRILVEDEHRLWLKRKRKVAMIWWRKA